MAKDMTEGRIVPQLAGFTIPLVLGNVFQLMYNAVDSIIVGRFVGDSALAAVGTSGPIMNVAILLISGLCMGAGILMSSLYGAKDYDALSRQISTTLWGGVVFSIAFTLAMLGLAAPVLRLIQVPTEMLSLATDYLRIIFVGLVFTFIYNFLANTLRALGDSRTPLYFLIMSALLNVLGDLVLVVGLGLGVHGSAISTVVSEALCCLGCAVYIAFRVPLLCMGRRWFVFDSGLLKKTVAYGGTSAMQQMCLQLGKIMIQAMVNMQGVSVIAAFAAVNRVDDFAYIPEQNIGHAMTTFIAQNKGAGKPRRIREGFRCGMLIEFVYALCLFVVMELFARGMMGLFVKDESVEVIDLGVSYIRLIAAMYILPAATNGIQGFFRGIGDLKVTLYSTFMNMLGRVVAVWLLLYVFHMSFPALAWANLAGWVVMLLFEVPLLVRSLCEKSH
jgi:putative MATE family efflux protein